MDLTAKQQELAQKREEVRRLEQELAEALLAEAQNLQGGWAPHGYYLTYDVMAGAFLGLFGATTSLLFNIVGALLIPPPAPLTPHPINLIRVYLTFPLKAEALTIDSGAALAIGCCLYLATGMLLGIPFQMAQSLLAPKASLPMRFLLSSVLAICVWIINFYGMLSWLQPALFGGNWIVTMIPWWVAMLTHLVFGWTMALAYPLGVFVPYRQGGNVA